MDPITLGAIGGASALGGIAQYYQSQKAAKASQDRLDEIKQLFDAIKPPNYDVSPNDPPEYIKEAIPEPAFDYSKMTPEQFQLVGKYVPSLAPQIQEQNPTLVSQTAAGNTGRQAQLDALQKLRQVSTQNTNPELEQQLSDANRQAQIASQSRMQSILQDQNRRGTLGSGAQLAAQLSGSENSMNQAAMQGQNAATEAYRQKLQALKDSANLGGQINQSEFGQQQTNANIINDFNNRTSRAAQQFQNQRAETLNQGQIHNLGAQQSIANQNTQQNNQQAVANRSRQDQLLSQGYNMQTGQLQYNNQLAGNLASAANAEKARQNTLKSQTYADQLSRAQGQAGILQQYNALGQQRAQDTNKAIQGVTDAGIAGGMAYGNQQARNTAEDRADARTQMQIDANNNIWDKTGQKRSLGYGDNTDEFANYG